MDLHRIGRWLRGHSRQLFVRGLGVLLPSVLTVWLLLAGYQFIQARIAEPINAGIRELVVRVTPWPRVVQEDIEDQRARVLAERQQRQVYHALPEPAQSQWLARQTRRTELDRWWRGWAFPMDLIGLVVAVAGIWIAGFFLGSYIGRRLYARGEALVGQVPLVGRVYPSIKQVTDFIVGEGFDAGQFTHVVAVQYPRDGIWCIGLATGDSMRTICEAAGAECMTVFVPTAPMPFTGYVISVPKQDVLELSLTIEDAVKFLVSGGVLTPPTQLVRRDGQLTLTDAAGRELPLPGARPQSDPSDAQS